MAGGQRIRVLHVDDDPEFGTLAADFLEREDDALSVVTATSASDGLSELAEGGIDCVVSDYEMPGQDGIEFLQAVRETHPDLPFILFTGKGSEAVASDAISAGVTDYLQKGSGTSQYAVLANRVRNAVEKYRTQAELAARENRLRILFEQSPLGVIEWDEDLSLVRMNERAAEILGYDDRGPAGASLDSLVAPAEADTVDRIRATVVDSDESHHGVVETVREDGERLACEWHTRAIRDEQGRIDAVFSQFYDVTERKRREQRLRDTTARLGALFENSPDMINIHDSAGTITDPNSTFCEKLGYDESELIGRKVWEIDQSIDPDEARRLWDDMDAGERRELEGVFQRRDGSTFPVEIHVRRLKLDSDPQFVVISRDITQRKQRESELETRLTAMESSIDGMAILDGDEYVYANQAHAEIYGYEDPDAFVGESWRMCYDDAELERIDTEIMPTLSAEGSWRGEATGACKDGSTFRQELSLTRLEDGKLICVVRDVTDRKRQEDALSTLHEATRAFMEAPDERAIANVAVETARTALDLPINGLWLHDDEADALEPVAVTDEAATLLGDPPTFTDGESLSWRAFEQETVKLYDDVRDHPDRFNPDPTIRSEIIVPLGDHGVMNFGATEPADFDAIDRSLARILGNTVEAALSRATREQQLRTQRRDLERQNERLENFTSVVSHDLRNPLNVALARTELAQEECPSPHLDATADALHRMEKLIDDLLTLAREGDPVDETERTDLSRLVRRCWATVETSDATLQVETDNAIRANQSRLKQLLENLVANAVEHGGPDVTVTVGDTDDGFYIADDGRGISADERDDVFEPGYTTADGGTGFGLQIVREIVEAHDWDVRVTESDGGGARFEIGGVELCRA